jgi:hypothetical protein
MVAPRSNSNVDRGGASTGVNGPGGGGFKGPGVSGLNAPSRSAPSTGAKSATAGKGPAASQAAAKASAQKQQQTSQQKQTVANKAPGTSQAAAKNTALGKAAQVAKQNVARPSGTSTQFGGPKLSSSPGYSFSQSQNAARVNAVRRGPGVVSGAMPGNTNALAQRRTLTAFGNSIAENPAFNRQYSPGALNMLPKAVIGEAQHEGNIGRAAVANVMMNRLALGASDPSAFGYLGAGSIPRMMRGIDAAGVDPNRPGLRPNAGYRNTRPGTEAYSDGLRAVADSLSPYSEFSQTATPRALNATHYYNDAISNPKWGEARSGTPFDRIGNHVFGNAERTAGQVAGLRAGPPVGTQIASSNPNAAAEAARIQRRDSALQTLAGGLTPAAPRPQARPFTTGAWQGAMPGVVAPMRDDAFARPFQPQAPIPNARPLQSFISGDPRASMPPGALPQTRMQSPVMGDPRANTAPGSYPAAPVRFAPPSDPRVGMPPGSYPAARMPSQVMGDPRANLPPGAFPAKPASVFADPRVGMPAGAYPQAKPISIVATDPRVNMQPGAYFNKDQSRIAPTSAPIAPHMVRPQVPGSYPAAAPAVDPQAALGFTNMPPMGGALPPDMAKAFGEWGVTRTPPAAPHLGTPASQTATLDDSQQQGWGGWIKDKTGVDVTKVATDVEEKLEEHREANKTFGPKTVLKVLEQRAGKVPQSLRGYGEASENQDRNRYLMAAGAGLMGGSPVSGSTSTQGGEPSLSQAQIAQLLTAMQQKGATPEEIAYVQSLIA